MQISERLKLVAGFVSQGKTMADIGTDHGYVPITLVKQGVVEKAYAMDINDGPLKRAVENVKREGLEKKIELRLSNGLEKLEKGEADTVVIAGMGGELTVKILKAGESVLETVKELVLSPHSEVFSVRKYLIEHNYKIVKEAMILDAGKYYTIIKAEHVEEKMADWTKEQYEYGKYLVEKKDKVFLSFLMWKREKYQQIMVALQGNDSSSAEERKRDMEEKIIVIDNVLRQMDKA